MQKKKEEKQGEMPIQEQIGFHKGALQTLVGERNELVKMVQITESLMQAHVEALKKLGVNLIPQKNTNPNSLEQNLNSKTP